MPSGNHYCTLSAVLNFMGTVSGANKALQTFTTNSVNVIYDLTAGDPYAIRLLFGHYNYILCKSPAINTLVIFKIDE